MSVLLNQNKAMRAFIEKGFSEGWLDTSAGTEVLEAFLTIIWDDQDMVELALNINGWQDHADRDAMLERILKAEAAGKFAAEMEPRPSI